MSDLQILYTAILEGNAPTAKSTTEQALAEGVPPQELLDQYMIPAMDEVGKRFEANEYFVPELLIAARAMKGALELIRPRLSESGVEPVGRVVIGTVKGDLHDIGKNLVASMLEGGGFEVVDLGVNTSIDKIVNAVREHQPQLVGFSAFLTTTMPMFKVNMEALEKAGLRQSVKVMVGGAPVTQEYCEVVGADGYAPDASSCVRLAKQLLAELKEKQPA